MGCPFLTTFCFHQQRCSLRYQDHCHASRILLGTQWHVTPVMTSGCGSPLPTTTALHSGLSPGQKKRDLCECLAHLTCAAQPSVTPAHISGWDLWTRKHGSPTAWFNLELLHLAPKGPERKGWSCTSYLCSPYQTKIMPTG